jgi:hypothetical protein
VSHDNLICLLRNHGTEFVVFGVDIVVQILNDVRKLFLRLLVQIRHCNTTMSVDFSKVRVYRAARMA